ncbi:small cell adhesion glycoprotein [Nycticebus coucang]|uniref:small cell adhesion glycoprotein n=1 Tax=Nycticebus coucang TaxID=9470 RepID=UPI00234C326D|nr:small cell adhesion glycoprotein [Nycticebus coucang]
MQTYLSSLRGFLQLGVPRSISRSRPLPASANLGRSRPGLIQKDARSGAGPSPAAGPTGKELKPRAAGAPRSPVAVSWSCSRRGARDVPPAAGRAGEPVPEPIVLSLGRIPPRAAMASPLTTPSPGEELMTTPILQATEGLSPEAGASTALIAVVITVVFLTLLSVVIFIFFYLYKNKGSYVTYESAEGDPSAILQMENDSAKGREKEEYFI